MDLFYVPIILSRSFFMPTLLSRSFIEEVSFGTSSFERSSSRSFLEKVSSRRSSYGRYFPFCNFIIFGQFFFKIEMKYS